ncbi:PPE family protein [Mycobacterium malmoense]|uniref:PPE family protein n=1 Tax=Mycobacterium malmoense TaxID=1780 RepID=UPI000A92B874|nr:PPE family protein [Mycobacterium malmoense]
MFFSFFPPEVNSGLMYAGPGSGPLVEAAAAWEELATDLYSTVASYQSVIANLTSGWSGPSAMAMASAAVPYVSWMSTTAAAAAEAGAQANAAVGAYETAFVMTVPPAVIAINRTVLAALIATNILGQNSPAIAALEAQYGEMWAQDVEAMNGYAVSAQAAVQVPALSTPPTMTNTASPLASIPDGASVLAGLTALGTQVQTALGALTTSAPVAELLNVTGLSSLVNGTGLSQSSIYSIEAAYYGVMMGSTPARMFMSMGNSASSSGVGLTGSSNGLLESIGQFIDGKMQLVVGGVTNQLKSWGGSISAQLAHASKIGGLSIPPGWSTAAQGVGMSRAAPVLPETSVATPAMAQASAMPQSPFAQALMGALSGRGLGGIAGKVPAKIMPRSPAGG